MSWKKQLALDLSALGNLPFYGIVYVITLINPKEKHASWYSDFQLKECCFIFGLFHSPFGA